MINELIYESVQFPISVLVRIRSLTFRPMYEQTLKNKKNKWAQQGFTCIDNYS